MNYDLWISENGREIFRQRLADGAYQLGRQDDNDLCIPSPHISRHHLELALHNGSALVTDLGSTNGIVQDGLRLPVQQPTAWLPGQTLSIGPLVLNLDLVAEAQAPPAQRARPETPPPAAAATERYDSRPSSPPRPPGTVPTLSSPRATPPVVALDENIATIGSSAGSSMRLPFPGVAAVHCTVRRFDNGVQVINRDGARPALLDNAPLPVGKPVDWSPGQRLRIGVAEVYLGAMDSAAAHALEAPPARSRSLLTLLVPLALGGLMLTTLLAVVAYFAFFRDGGGPAGTPTSVAANGIATPTLAPAEIRATQSAGGIVITIPPTRDGVVATAVPCVAPETVAAARPGFLDLPFPYQGVSPVAGGSADQFRRISQRSRFGGRINSFFDHEYPVYPPMFGGLEPTGVYTTMVIFDGSRSADNFSMDSNSGDWYSGHSGIDYAPSQARQENTPILAAAAGIVYLVTVDVDGNHMVWLAHDPYDPGDYEYATLYFHLAPDAAWDSLLARFQAAQASGERLTVSQGEQIGFMGTTGRSSGVHLHFEVRRDVNGDGNYLWNEKVDPYGFFPSDVVPADPWSEERSWVSASGQQINHGGVTSEYLWIHPLTGEVQDEAVDPCANADTGVTVQVNLYDVLGWTVLHPGFTLVLRNEAGDIIDRDGEPHFRNLTVPRELMANVFPRSVRLDYFDPTFGSAGRWVTVSGQERLLEQANGSFVYRAEVFASGRYVLVAQPTIDTVAPETRIDISGVPVPGERNVYRGTVSISLAAVEFNDGIAPVSGVRQVEYSLDCGDTWAIYDNQPFTVTLAMAGGCGSASGSEGLQLDDNEFLLLAIASDNAGNEEQPFSQATFALESP